METMTMCTKLCVDEIVHGGEDILARTIREAKDLPISALFVISSCGPEIVGDDITAVCNELQPEVKFRLVPIPCPGFRGSQDDGIDIALDVMLKRLVKAGMEKVPVSVCLVAPHANANPTWVADLDWVKQTLSRMGIPVVATLTHRTPLAEIENVASAETSLLLSHDAGQKAVDYLSATYGTEPVCTGIPLPIGMTNTRRWLMALGERFGAEKTAESMVAEGERMVMATCRRKWPMARFLYPDTGGDCCRCHGRDPARPVRDRGDGDDPGARLPVHVAAPGTGPARGGTCKPWALPPVVFGTDVYQTRKNLAEIRPRVIFGSTIERHASEGLGAPYVVEVVRMMRQFRMINREYFGYTGILNLFECVQNEWTMAWRSKEKRYEAKW